MKMETRKRRAWLRLGVGGKRARCTWGEVKGGNRLLEV
jgi:hypothetical protein